MQYTFLMMTVLLISAQGIMRKIYNKKTTAPCIYFFSTVNSLGVLLFFLFNSKFKVAFDPALMPYAASFGIAFGAAVVGNTFAIRFGSFSITSLVLSYSMLIPTAYGIIVYHDNLKVVGYVGIVCLLVSVFMIRTKDREEKQKISLKWIVSLAISFIGNGMCSTVQKMQQVRFNGAYKNELMIYALAICFVVFLILTAATREKISEDFALSVPFGLGTGVAAGIVNLFVMILQGNIPTAILYPSVSAGGIVLAFFIALLMFKEKLTKEQMVGYFIGVVSVICLNL